MEIDEIINNVKECITEVYEILGGGYLETVYEEALAIEFRKRDIPYEIERNIEVLYKGEKVGTHRLDFIVMRDLVVELKSVTRLTNTYIKQIETYLKSNNMQKGLLVNFPYPQANEPEIKVIIIDEKKEKE